MGAVFWKNEILCLKFEAPSGKEGDLIEEKERKGDSQGGEGEEGQGP